MQISKSNSSMHLFVDGLINPKETVSDQDDAQKFYKQSQILLQLQRLDEAMQYIDQAIYLKPQYVEAYYLKGDIYRKQKNLKEALKNYEECVKLKTQYYFVYYNIGLILNEMNRKEEAIKNFDISLSYQIKYETLINKGILCLDLFRYEECLLIYDLAIAQQPNCHIAYYSKGFTLYKLKKYEESIESYNKALMLNPQLINGFNNKAVSLSKINKINEAIEYLNYGLKISKNDPVIIFNLIKLYRLTNNLQKSNQLKEIIKNVQPQWQALQKLEEIEKFLEEAKTELLLILDSNQDSFDQKFSQFYQRLDQEYRNLWNYDLEFENTNSTFTQKDEEKIQEIVRESLNTEESQLKHQLLQLEDRVYFQSMYWRLSNYIKVAKKIYQFNEGKNIQQCINEVNQSLEPLLPEQDKILFETKQQKNQAFQTQSTFSSFNAKNNAQDVHLRQIRNKLRKASQKTQVVKSFSKSQSGETKKSTLFSQNKSISEFNSDVTQSSKESYLQYCPLPITEQIINEINLSLGINSFQDQKIGQILKVFSNKTKNNQQLNAEIQKAAISMSASIQNIKCFNQNVEKILQLEQLSNPKLLYIKGLKWIRGIDDTIQILNYFQEQYKLLVEPQSAQLHFQIMASSTYFAKSKNAAQNKKNKLVERTQESCACQIF
ncbi:unnamed protein product [Paramecium sonneborni]|uniref:Tetratricopeptide repeat protein n=1 Tax=Paramecium sonneborni TaxID=65129 RepID=A0A8S1RID0_9CILI|nr:unnamed protein product [Paramecium sonneborni]